MTKARNLSKIIDGDGNLVIPNAGSNARSLGIVKADGSRLDALDRSTRQATVANATSTGYLGGGNCSTAVSNNYIDETYNTSAVYEDGTGEEVQQTNIPKPPNGNWWTWSGLGFSGIPTSNCQNQGSYDGAGGNTNSLQSVGVSNVTSGFSTVEDEIGGSYQTRSVQNCNCGSFNCRTNCNCNCACACDCDCGNG